MSHTSPHKQPVDAAIPIPDWRDVERRRDEDSSEEEEDLSNGSFAIRHVIWELEERNRRFQFLKNIGKGEGVPIIDVKGILEDMRTKKAVARHELYKGFLQMVQDHYSIRDDSLETDDMLASVRSMITDNALTLKDLFATQEEQDEGEEEILDLDVDEAWTEDVSGSGRHFYDNFVPPAPPVVEDTEDAPVDIEDETEDLEEPESPKPSLTPKQIQEFLAATDSGNDDSDYSESSPQKRKRVRPRKLDQKPKIIILTEVKEKRGRGRPRKKPPLFPTNLEATPDEPTEETEEQKERRKRGRPKKLKIAEITITTQTLGEAIKLQSPQKLLSPISPPSTPTTPTPDKPKRGRGRPRKIRPVIEQPAEEQGATMELSPSNNGYSSPENSMNISNQNMSPDDTGALNMENTASNYTAFSENASLAITEDMLEECISPHSEDTLLPPLQPLLPAEPPVVKRKRGRPRKTRPIEQSPVQEMKEPVIKIEKVITTSNVAEDESSNRAKSPKKIFQPHTLDEESRSKRRRKLSVDGEEKTNGRSRSKGTRVRL
jgi:hypothetical protein